MAHTHKRRRQNAARCSSPRGRLSICSKASISRRATGSRASHTEEQSAPKPGTCSSGNKDLWCCTTQRRVEGGQKKGTAVVAEVCFRQGRNARNQLLFAKKLRRVHGVSKHTSKTEEPLTSACTQNKTARHQGIKGLCICAQNVWSNLRSTGPVPAHAFVQRPRTAEAFDVLLFALLVSRLFALDKK